jgi:peptidoglycan/LPS O-acetylase OafA/YrhL
MQTVVKIETKLKERAEGERFRPESRPELEALTSLRFFLTTMLVWAHAGPLLGATNLPGEAMWGMSQCLAAFFVLSGFVLFYNYFDRCSTDRERHNFIMARFARILPLYAFTSLFFILTVPATSWAAAQGPALLLQFVAKCLALQAWILPDIRLLSLNPPSWSISTEFFFYLIFPFLLINWERNWKAKLGGALGLVGFCAVIATIHKPEIIIYGMGPEYHWLLCTNPLARLFEFVLGMATAYAFLKLSKREIPSTRILTVAQFFSVVIFVISVWASSWLTSHYMRWHAAFYAALTYWFAYTSGALPHAVLMFTMAFKNGAVAAFLSNRVFEYLGRVSFSMFLLHWTVMVWFHEYLPKTWVIEPHLKFILYCVTLTVLSVAAHELIEVPARKAILKIARRA